MASNPIDDIRELMDRLNALPQTQILNEKFGDSIRGAFGDKEAKGRQAAAEAYQTFWDGWTEWKGATGAKGTVADMVQFLHTRGGFPAQHIRMIMDPEGRSNEPKRARAPEYDDDMDDDSDMEPGVQDDDVFSGEEPTGTTAPASPAPAAAPESELIDLYGKFTSRHDDKPVDAPARAADAEKLEDKIEAAADAAGVEVTAPPAPKTAEHEAWLAAMAKRIDSMPKPDQWQAERGTAWEPRTESIEIEEAVLHETVSLYEFEGGEVLSKSQAGAILQRAVQHAYAYNLIGQGEEPAGHRRAGGRSSRYGGYGSSDGMGYSSAGYEPAGYASDVDSDPNLGLVNKKKMNDFLGALGYEKDAIQDIRVKARAHRSLNGFRNKSEQTLLATIGLAYLKYAKNQ